VALSPARTAAYEVVRRVRERDAYTPQVLDSVLGARRLSDDDRALATRLARGTVASTGALDEAIDRFAAKPSAIEPQVRDALRVAAFELLFARTPARAAVHQGVESVRRLRPQAAGLANAILRRLADAAPEFPWGDPASDIAALARLTAHPLWLVERVVAERGYDIARDMLSADDEAAPLYLAHVPFTGTLDAAVAALEADGAEPLPGPLTGSLVAGRPAAAVRGRAVANGLVIVADAAAQLAPRLASPRAGQVVVDIAAGRGTKTILLQAAAVAAGGPCRLFAVDVHASKTRILRERLDAMGVPDVTVVTGDATDVSSLEGLPAAATADAVLVDVPCSGTGALRRHPEKRWRITPEQVTSLAAIQGDMLSSAARLVRPGGVVVYSTCSILAEENGSVVEGFLRGSAGAFSVADVRDAVPPEWARYLTPEGFFQSLPAVDGPDGHFVAVLRHR
jgi:16S rRNA (cytosine967-C5)-methyltransferase